MLDLYEQCEYKMYIINQKKKKKNDGGHIHVIHNTEIKIIVILTIKNKMVYNKLNNIDYTKNDNNDDFNNNKSIIMIIIITVSQNN